MVSFSGIDEYRDVAESIHKDINSNEIEYRSGEDPLCMHRTGSSEAALVLTCSFSVLQILIKISNQVI